MNVSADIKKTGQHKTINGFDAEEMVVTMVVDNTQAQRPGAKGQPAQMQMEMHIWFASDVPGIDTAHAFYEKNADRMPWAAMAGGNTSIGLTRSRSWCARSAERHVLRIKPERRASVPAIRNSCVCGSRISPRMRRISKRSPT